MMLSIRKPDVGAPGSLNNPQTIHLDPMNLMNLSPAGKGENFPFPLSMAAGRLMQRFDLSPSLADAICRMAGMGGANV
jgi:hypothetical protein